jgi:hypothetical protein
VTAKFAIIFWTKPGLLRICPAPLSRIARESGVFALKSSS